MNQTETREKIMDVAEELFALNGFQGTSLRAITSGAGVNLAAVNYHFGSKEGLTAAVISRRLVALNESRRLRFDELRRRTKDTGTTPQAGEVLRAFVEPTLRFPETLPEAGHFLILVSRALSEPDETIRKIFFKHMRGVIEEFRDLLAAALPELPEDILFWRLNFTIGSLSHTMRCINRSPMNLPGGAPRDAHSLVDLILPYLTAGMEAPHE